MCVRITVRGFSLDAAGECALAVVHGWKGPDGRAVKIGDSTIKKRPSIGTGTVESSIAIAVAADTPVGSLTLIVSVQDAKQGIVNWTHDLVVKDWVFGIYQTRILVESRVGMAPVLFSHQDFAFSALVTCPAGSKDIPTLYCDVRELGNAGNSILAGGEPFTVPLQKHPKVSNAFVGYYSGMSIGKHGDFAIMLAVKEGPEGAILRATIPVKIIEFA